MNLFLDLLPMILGTALAPAWIILVLVLLRSPDGLVKTIAFVAGTTVVRLLQGIVFGFILRNAEAVRDADDTRLIVSILLSVLGILLLIAAAKKFMNEDDPDAPPPKWLTTFDRATSIAVFSMGAVATLIAPKLWAFTLSALGIIRGANLELWDELKVFLLYVLAAEVLLILPLLFCAVMPHRSAQVLQSASSWLMKHSKPISVIASLVFGIFFLQKGLSGLL